MFLPLPRSLFFFFNDTATTEIYTLSLHDALPILAEDLAAADSVLSKAQTLAPACKDDIALYRRQAWVPVFNAGVQDRKSTRLNSSHLVISYAVFCLKKKKTIRVQLYMTNIEQSST